MKTLAAALLAAAMLWFLMFAPQHSVVGTTISIFSFSTTITFWKAMAFSAMALAAFAVCARREDLLATLAPRSPLRELALGIAIAVALWCVFWIGDKASTCLFHFARPQVEAIYAMKHGEHPATIAALLVFLIGPAEEIFWRGYVQRTLATRWNATAAYIVATLLYTLVHLPSANFMLVMAAMVCGIAWGGIFRLLPRHLPALVVSHALWDAAAFVWFPL